MVWYIIYNCTLCWMTMCILYSNYTTSVYIVTTDHPRLPGREKELQELKEYVTSHLLTRTPGSVYVSGGPGTGKTATLTKIISGITVSFNNTAVVRIKVSAKTTV